jgi:predicted TIM-barrel fold metal-dependent hydrolase
MVLDGHIHIWEGEVNQKRLLDRMRSAGIDGGNLFSQSPPFHSGALRAGTPKRRLHNLMSWCEDAPTLNPFFWIDPVEPDAVEQVQLAVDTGVAGFKVICSHFYPSDERAMRTFRAIASLGKPIMFHSGILYDGKPTSQFSRPVNFEVMLDIPGVKFSLAHISWPWVDECISVYGKFASARRYGTDVEMFIDTTPGTPRIYRQEALTKVFTVGYDVTHNIIFGSDCTAGRYDPDYARMWIDRDREIIEALDLSDNIIDNVFSNNVQRFVGIDI